MQMDDRRCGVVHGGFEEGKFHQVQKPRTVIRADGRGAVTGVAVVSGSYGQRRPVAGRFIGNPLLARSSRINRCRCRWRLRVVEVGSYAGHQ